MKTAELLSGTDGAYLFHYFTKDEFKTLTIYVSEYQSGTLISKSKVADLDYDGIDSPSRGVIAVVPDFESFKVKLIVADDYAKYSTDFPILENSFALLICSSFVGGRKSGAFLLTFSYKSKKLIVQL